MTAPHPHRDIALFGLIVAALLAMLTLAGCDHRTQAQDVANARAGAQAYRQAPPAAKPVIAAGLADYVLAATDRAPDLPAPSLSPEQIIQDPAAYTKAGAAAAADPQLVQPPAVGAGQAAGGDHGGAFAGIAEAGRACVDWGRLIGAIGMVGWLVGWAIDFFGVQFTGIAGLLVRFAFNRIIGPVYKIGASFGGAAVAVGIALEWIGNHPVWSVLLLVGGAGGWIAIVHHRDIPAWAAGVRHAAATAWRLLRRAAAALHLVRPAPAPAATSTTVSK